MTKNMTGMSAPCHLSPGRHNFPVSLKCFSIENIQVAKELLDEKLHWFWTNGHGDDHGTDYKYSNTNQTSNRIL